MPTAKTNLDGAIVNDPSHPAFREFVIQCELILEEANKKADIKSDVVALCLIQLEMMKLKRTIFGG